MLDPRNKWRVIETPCFPNSWKVVNDYYRPNNSFSEYFPSPEVARAEADRRNQREVVQAAIVVKING